MMTRFLEQLADLGSDPWLATFPTSVSCLLL